MREPEPLGERGEQPLLGGGLRELAAERFPRIGERVVDEVLALAALGHRDLDLVAALGGQRGGEQLAVGNRLRR